MKSGTGEWGPWTLKTASPQHEAAYTESVPLVEGHQSYVAFRLDYTLAGEALSVYSQSAGMDFGSQANVVSGRGEYRGDRLWVVAAGDSDMRQTGVQIIGTVSTVSKPPDPTLAGSAYSFALEDTPERNGEFDTGFDVANPGPNVDMIVWVKLRAISIDGQEGPVVTFRADRRGSDLPTVSIDTFTHTREQGGTACTTDPAQSRVVYSVTKGGTDTVTIERWVDGSLEATIRSASTTAADTIIDDHEFYEDPPAIVPTKDVRYRIIVKTSGGTVLASAWSDEETFLGVVGCP